MVRLLTSLLFALLFAGVAQAATIALPQTGQTKCYNASGGEIACAGTGQDGEIRAGVSWETPRFHSYYADTLTDILTGLMWTKNANAPAPPSLCAPGTTKTWTGALTYVKCLNDNKYLTFSDWRLPNILELRSLTNAGSTYWLSSQGFTSLQEEYWSSTTYATSTGSAMTFSYSFLDGKVRGWPKSNSLAVWPVRNDTERTALISMPKTGQTVSYAANDDGALQKGAAWPSPRFSDNGNGTVTDNLSGLMWLQNADCFANNSWTDALAKAGNLADGDCSLSDESSPGDWRLPNIVEMASLVHWGQISFADWLNGQGFSGVRDAPYWTSTTYNPIKSQAWVLTSRGLYDSTIKTNSANNYLWPVRDVTVKDTDGDGIPDNIDDDDDNDGLPDNIDPYPLIFNYQARIGGSYYWALSPAFNAAVGGNTIQAQDGNFPGEGTVSLVTTGSVKFVGGFDTLFNAISGKTRLQGALLLNKGTLVVQGLEIY